MTATESFVFPLHVEVMPRPTPWFRSGTLGWALVAAGVLAWDLAAPETLSEAFHRVNSRPAGRVMVAGVWVVLTLHLFGKLPKPVDPLHAVAMARTHLRSHEFICCADPWPE
jgi:hypothetical protein